MTYTKKARVIAYYLPQFHPIPENDYWWGKGFTEWTNVGKAKPLFKGHDQPRVPTDLGYYDLRMPEVREAQAKLAGEAGIEGFMYWHYWFGNGKRVLEKPFDEVLKTKSPNFPFCLGWANHSWTNTSWTANRKEKKDSVIFEQTYPGEDDYILHFNCLLPAFKDERYMTVDGKPIFVIYDPFAIPDIQLLFSIWNNMANNNGLPGIYFIGVARGWVENFEKVKNLGFDAVNTNGQWHAESKVLGKYARTVRYKIINKLKVALLDKFKYSHIINNLFTKYDRLNSFYPTIIPQWDRSPRSGSKAVIYEGSTPELFEQHVRQALDLLNGKDEKHRILFLKSWNEWGEGNYMEPDITNGHGYLNALKKVIIDDK